MSGGVDFAGKCALAANESTNKCLCDDIRSRDRGVGMVYGVEGVNGGLSYRFVLGGHVVVVVDKWDSGLAGPNLGVANEASCGADRVAGPDVVGCHRRNNRDGALRFERVDSILHIEIECMNDFGGPARNDKGTKLACRFYIGMYEVAYSASVTVAVVVVSLPSASSRPLSTAPDEPSL